MAYDIILAQEAVEDLQAVEILAILDKSETTTWLAEYGELEEGNDDETGTAFGSEE
jgi:hypothetical protein